MFTNCVTYIVRSCVLPITFTESIKKRSERRKHCARAGYSKVRTPPARPPARCKQTNTQTGPITIHCAAKLSAQCNNNAADDYDDDDENANCAEFLVSHLMFHHLYRYLSRCSISPTLKLSVSVSFSLPLSLCLYP